jgi:Zn-dependent metalloprotease
MGFTIKPQDQRSNQSVAINLTASQFERVRMTAELLDNSTVDYIIGQLIEQGCESEEALRKKLEPKTAERPEPISSKTAKPGKRDEHSPKGEPLAATA